MFTLKQWVTVLNTAYLTGTNLIIFDLDVNQFRPRAGRHFLGPELGPNC